LKKQERNDRQTALLPTTQRSRIIPNKNGATPTLHCKKADIRNNFHKNSDFQLLWAFFGFGSKENIGHRLAANLRDIKRFCDDLLRTGIMRRAQTG
jgi:hypothetical protein